MAAVAIVVVTVILTGCSGGGGGSRVISSGPVDSGPTDPMNPGEPADPADPECPGGQVGTPPNCEVPPPPMCPEGQVGTPPNCEVPPPPQTLSEQYRGDAGFGKIAPNGVFPSNHASIVKPQFAVIEATTAREHGGSIQAAACVGYAPGGCKISESATTAYSVSNAPFIFIEPSADQFGNVFQAGDIASRMQSHPNLKLVSMSLALDPSMLLEINREGAVAIWSAGNEGVDFTDPEASGHLWVEDPPPPELSEEDRPRWERDQYLVHGDRILEQIAANKVLLVAGYDKQGGSFVPELASTECGGVEKGCLYAPYSFDFDGDGTLDSGGTSLSAPFMAAGLASVLAVFPQTSGTDLVRLAKRCAVSEPGLNGLGRFSLACMDNSSIFHLNKGTTVQGGEETPGSIQQRQVALQQMFASTPLPGNSQFTAQVEGVSLVRDMEGAFSYSSGITLPRFNNEEEEDRMKVEFFHDKERNAPGVYIGNNEVFFVGSWSMNDSFFGYQQYEAKSLNAAAGTENLYVRYSDKRGEKRTSGLVSDVRGYAVGVTASRTVATPIGELTPFLHADRFEGGSATTAFGSMELQKSQWNYELGFSFAPSLSESFKLSATTSTVSHDGVRGVKDHSMFARYDLSF